MSYVVLARRWRPLTFAGLVGQPHVSKTLENAIRSSRVAHAFLFAGIRGVGKTSAARILARALNCLNGPAPEPCGTCESCTSIKDGTAVDVVEIDGASHNSVDDVRSLRETVPYRPVIGRYKIYIIDEVHMLSTSAFNAILKTLEEPPPHVKFIFATTEPQKIPATILSRCQRYDFHRISIADIVGQLELIVREEKFETDVQTLTLLAREADGSMRDALSLLDQIMAALKAPVKEKDAARFLGVVSSRVLYDFSRALLEHDPASCISLIEGVDREGYDLVTFSRHFLEHLRNLVVAGLGKSGVKSLDLPKSEVSELVKQASSTESEDLHRYFRHFSHTCEDVARSSFPRLILEMSLVRMAHFRNLVPASELVARIESMLSSSTITKGHGGSGNPGPSSSGEKTQQSGRKKKSGPGKGSSRVKASGEADSLEMWKDLLEDLRKTQPLLASALEHCAPLKVGAEEVRLGFAEDGFALKRVSADENLGKLQAFLDNYFSNQVNLVIEASDVKPPTLHDEQSRKLEEEKDKSRREAVQSPLVQKALREFGGTVKKIQTTYDQGGE